MISLAVGQFAAIINIFTLVLVAVADRAVELIVRNFSVARLRKTTRAPVVHDSDTWLPNIPRSLLRFYKFPAIVLTLLCSLLLVISELVTELGVETNKKCGPITQSGPVISANDTSDSVTFVELGASSFFLQGIEFLDGDLSRSLRAGFPRQVSKSTCTNCIRDNTEGAYVIKECKVFEGESYPAGTMELKMNKSSSSAYGTVVESFKDIERNIIYEGLGDVTRNNYHCGAFLFVGNEPGDNISTELSVTYFEYEDYAHCSELLDDINDQNIPDPGFRATRGIVRTFYISCYTTLNKTNNTLNLKLSSFLKALRGYRSMHFENVAKPIIYDENKKQFQNITEDEVYRSVLSLKLIADGNERGEYKVYTECGTYNPIFIIPFVISLVLIVVLGLSSKIILRKVGDIDIPYTSQTWYDQVNTKDIGGIPATESNPRKSYFDLSPDIIELRGDDENNTRLYINRDDEEPQNEDLDGGMFDRVGAGLPNYLTEIKVGPFADERDRRRPQIPTLPPTDTVFSL